MIQRLADAEREQVKWLWDRRIPIGKITVLDGDPEVGKSYLSLALATAVTLGSALPDEDAARPAKSVLILTAEDGLGDTVRPRAEDMGADITRVFCLTAVSTSDGTLKHFSLADDVHLLEEYLQSGSIGLVIIDPINAYLGAYIDNKRDTALRAVLTPLAALAAKYQVAVLVIRHLTKGNREKAIYRGQGSIAYVAAARSVLLVGRNPNDQVERAVICIKKNLAAHPPAVAFEIVEGQFRWTGLSKLTADDLLLPEAGEQRTAVDVAGDFLREALKDGARPMTEVEKEAKAHGISTASLRRARQAVGVRSARIGEAGKQGGGIWLWSLPHERPGHSPGLGVQPGLGAQRDHLENVITLTPRESESTERGPEEGLDGCAAPPSTLDGPTAVPSTQSPIHMDGVDDLDGTNPSLQPQARAPSKPSGKWR